MLSLSLGYYHEQPADLAFDPQLLAPLQALGRMGVAVVVAAGNDATDRPCYPAAFAPWPGGSVTTLDKQCLPIVSVGALNPNETDRAVQQRRAVGEVPPPRRVAWSAPTRHHQRRASRPRSRPSCPGDGVRATTDPDDFSSGFAVWSGTSFAAPVLAGELAAQLCAARPRASCDAGAMVERGWAALSACVPELAP